MVRIKRYAGYLAILGMWSEINFSGNPDPNPVYLSSSDIYGLFGVLCAGYLSLGMGKKIQRNSIK
jgi:hypothetical protein